MTLGSADHVALHSNVNDDVIGLATKVGKGASVPNTAGVLRVTNTGTQSTGFGLVQTADIGLLQVTAAQIANDTITAAQIAAGGVGASEVADGSLTYIEFAANAATQVGAVLGASGTITTTSTTAVDMTDMSCPITTVGGVLVCWFAGITFTNTAAGSNNYWFKLDAAADSFAYSINLPTANMATNVGFVAVFSGVSAGAHTIKVRWAVGATQTGTMFGNQRYLIVTEFRR